MATRKLRAHSLRKVEGTLALLDGHTKLLLHDIQRAVIRHLEIVHAGHDTWQIVVRAVRGLTWLADDREQRGEGFETYAKY